MEIREIKFTKEFLDFITSLNLKVREKYMYVMQIMSTEYLVNEKFVKKLQNSPFYEMRVSVSSNEYRSIIFAIDADSFIQSKKVLMLNSFLKKDTKQYRTELKKAETIYNAWRIEYEED
jgi:hypothetical protein